MTDEQLRDNLWHWLAGAMDYSGRIHRNGAQAFKLTISLHPDAAAWVVEQTGCVRTRRGVAFTRLAVLRRVVPELLPYVRVQRMPLAMLSAFLRAVEDHPGDPSHPRRREAFARTLAAFSGWQTPAISLLPPRVSERTRPLDPLA